MGEGHSVEAGDRGLRQRATVVTCSECQTMSGLRWAGWRAYRIDDPELVESPALAFYCPTCAERRFGFGADPRRGPGLQCGGRPGPRGATRRAAPGAARAALLYSVARERLCPPSMRAGERSSDRRDRESSSPPAARGCWRTLTSWVSYPLWAGRLNPFRRPFAPPQ